jgi:5-deoxy-D-glucuronate isomerase
MTSVTHTVWSGTGPDPTPARVENLTLSHAQLDSCCPITRLVQHVRELVIYALTGRIRVYAHGMFLGTLGGRTTVRDSQVQVMRFPAGRACDVTLVLEGVSADCVLASCDAPPNVHTQLPYTHWNDTPTHVVGVGTHQRTVAEVMTPPGFQIACGETLNIPGGVSSWPPHATPEDVARYHRGETTWHEAMLFVTPGVGTLELDGVMPNGQRVHERHAIHNGEIREMCLGSHPITAPAHTWLYYAWFYCGTALQKQYRKFATDVGTYVK